MENSVIYGRDFWQKLDKYAVEKYIIDDGGNHFVRNRKTTQESIMKYPFYNCGRTTAIEAISFIRNETKDKNMTLSKSDISQRRKLIKHLCYVDMNKDFIDGIYKNPEELSNYKGKLILACDSSICDAPNIGYTEKELKELNNPHFNRLKKELIRFRASCIADAQSDFILTSKLVNQKKMGEVELALNHLDELDQRINMTQTITTYDRGYCAVELMIKHILQGSHFVNRLRVDDFENEIKWMESNDEQVLINLNRNRTQNFHDKKLKDKAKKMGRLPIRITKVKLINKRGEEYTEILASNLPFEEFTDEDLKEIYRRRWKIETNFDRLKNILHIENYSGYSEEIIKQDFYSNIFLFNFLMLMKLGADEKIEEKHKDQNLKHEYKTNLNVLYGLIKLEMPDVLSDDPVEKNNAIERIFKIAQSNLVEKNKTFSKNPDRKIKDPTNKFPPTQKDAC